MPVTEMLSEGGPVAKRLRGFEIRPQQCEMADAVAEAFACDKHLLVEAGTGVGKTFAYLIPAIERALSTGVRVVVSTHTIALQEQLIDKDIPFLKTVFSKDFSAELVKGRSNYIGLRRLARASGKQNLLFATNNELAELWRIEDWAYKTRDGSLADMAKAPSLPVWDRVKSETEDCLGRKCPHYTQCFYQRARRRAAGAQLLIVNHALLFSDLALRRAGGELLPPYEYVILDEAHTVENVAGDHLGLTLTDAQIRHLLNTLFNERTGRGMLANASGETGVRYVTDARNALNDYFHALPTVTPIDRNGATGRLREPPSLPQAVSNSLMELREHLRTRRDDVSDEEDRSELAGLMDRCSLLAKSLDDWHHQRNEGWVHWVEVSGPRGRVSLNARPVEVGPLLRELLFDRVKSAVLTSATLTTTSEDPYAHIRGRLNLDGTRGLALGSPFDFARQMVVYVEASMPDPADSAAFMASAIEAIKKYVLRSNGRAFVLFTSFDMLSRCAEALAPFFAEHSMPLWIHGSGASRSALLTGFRTNDRSVLFGADTFWAGVDVPGEALSNVIIVKLPFAVPSHPTVEARIESIRASGQNPFLEFQVPQAVLRFKQGIGRLIRTKTDTGMIVILDPRVTTKPYGRQFLAALPECRVIVEREGTTEQRGRPVRRSKSKTAVDDGTSRVRQSEPRP